MRRVYRFDQSPLPDRGHYDTSVEHSYLVTMMAWYIIDRDNLDLSKDLVLKYLLVHDIIETYADDTDFFNTEEQATKSTREEQARRRLQKELPEFIDLHIYQEQYETQTTPESVFAHAADKLIDPVLIYMDHGRNWKDYNISLDQVLTKKTPHITPSPEIKKYWDELVILLKKDESKLFPK